MQGRRSAVGSLPEFIDFEHGSTSSDGGLDQQMFWSGISNSGQSRLPNFRVSSSDTSMQYVNSPNHHGPTFSGWDFGESSSRVGQNEGSLNGLKTEHGWSAPINVSARNVLLSEIQQYGPSNILSGNNVHVNLQSDGIEDANETLLVQNSGSHQVPQDLNVNSELEEDDDDCQVIEFPHVYKSRGSRNQPISFDTSSAFACSSSNPFGGVSNETGRYLIEENNDRAGSSSDGRRLLGKRKIFEGNGEQSSGGGSASYVQHSESRLWHAVPPRPSAFESSSTAAPVENILSFNLPEQLNPRYGSSVGQVACGNPSLPPNSGTIGSSRRNFRLRMNGTHQQGSLASGMVATESNTGNINVPSTQHTRQIPLSSLDVRPASAVENPNSEAQPGVVHVSSSHRNPQSRRNAASGLRSRNSSSTSVSGERTATTFDPANLGVLPRSISGYPMFAPPSETRSSVQSAPSWGLAGGNVNNLGNVASSSRIGAGASAHSVIPPPSHQSLQYQNRLSESLRRALLPVTDAGAGGQDSNNPTLHSGSASQGMSLPSGSSRQGRHSRARSAMLLERHPVGAPGIPNSVRALAASSGERSRLMSELRNVLDLVRRGEGLRFEDVMLLDQSLFFGMTDIHDQHRDMRLDVDNMSYEELLALEERIGSVNTGLNEESIVKQLKQRKHVGSNMDEAETEPCCICQEEYKDDEILGTLECGHDYHAVCIKKWLMLKNLCPICKTTGLNK